MPRQIRPSCACLLLIALFVFAGCDAGPSPDAPSAGDAPALPSSIEGRGQKNLYQPGDASEDVIPGQYIVVLKDQVATPGTPVARSAVQQTASAFAQMSGVQIRHQYSTALSGFSATLSDQALAQVASDPRVAFVEKDRRVHAVATQTGATWGLDRSDQRSGTNGQYTYSATGQGVTAYIIDTGIRTAHSEFGGRASAGFDAFGEDGQDGNGHGTHVAGTVGGRTYGIAKDVALVAVRVLNDEGSGSNSGVIAGVDWVTENASGPSVANMSLGGGASQALDNAIQNSINSGVAYAVAAGNENQNACNVSPARVDDALAVGSTTSSDRRSSFSNYGSCVDIFAPGSSITSAWHTSNTATRTISGTSMASPHVAGVAALYLESNAGASPAEVFGSITSTATQGALSGIRSGSPNRLLFSPLSEGGDSGGGDGGDGDDAPCSDCAHYTNALSGPGDYDYQPDGDYFSFEGGTLSGYLRGPSNADFDLYLWKWNGRRWVTVASATSPSSSEDLVYDGSSGTYVWRLYSYSGSGSYDFYAGP